MKYNQNIMILNGNDIGISRIELNKDYKCDFISEDDYDEFKQKYLFEINKLNLEKENLNKSKINSYNLD